MAIKGISMLPVKVTTTEALDLYKKVSGIKSIIGKMNSELAHSIANTNILQALSLSESVESTRIEGTQVTFADMIDQATLQNKTKEVVEVENYQLALKTGIDLIESGNTITSKMIRQLHSILMGGDARGATASAGDFRKIQNFIGPTRKIEDAVYIPISAGDIPDYMTNLEYYINSTEHISFNKEVNENETILDETSDTLIKTAIIHAQFESIHPFLDGNGRLGRILIVLAPMMDKLIDYPVFFISEELEKERIRYYNRLNGVRGENPDWYGWISFFLDATYRMAENLITKLENVNKLAKKGLEKTGSKNRNLGTVWFFTISNMFCTAKDVSKTLGITPQTARKHLNELVELELLEKDRSRSRNILYINYDLLRVLNN